MQQPTPAMPDEFDQSILSAIQWMTDMTRANDTRVKSLVAVARKRGIPWKHIAKALRVTPQAAQQKFGTPPAQGPK